ncbi:hypothetical protein ACNAN0_03800 [Agrilactobacillus fermenti]|uniref:hypothetical protein n=1 Tax=Agrilactobacillus fermenti TaxID=2586909 RepID=UPI003A5C5EB8
MNSNSKTGTVISTGKQGDRFGIVKLKDEEIYVPFFKEKSAKLKTIFSKEYIKVYKGQNVCLTFDKNKKVATILSIEQRPYDDRPSTEFLYNSKNKYHLKLFVGIILFVILAILPFIFHPLTVKMNENYPVLWTLGIMVVYREIILQFVKDKIKGKIFKLIASFIESFVPYMFTIISLTNILSSLSKLKLFIIFIFYFSISLVSLSTDLFKDYAVIKK